MLREKHIVLFIIKSCKSEKVCVIKMSRLFKSDETSSEPKMMANYQHQLFYHLNQCAVLLSTVY